MASLSPQVVLVFLVAAAQLPFLNQAFHIDDRIYLEIAENILRTPLFPYDYPPLFEGLISPDAASHSHLPLIPYYLALIKLVTHSEREWIYHLAFIIFPVLAVLGFYDIATRHLRNPFVATVLLAVAPAFYVLCHTLMTELALLAFWIVALSRFLRMLEGSSSRLDRIFCALSLLAASWISLLTAGLLLLMTIALYLRGTRSESRSIGNLSRGSFILLLIIPILSWLVWYVSAYLHYDRLVLLNTFLHISKRAALSWDLLGEKTVSFIVNCGGVFLFPLALWYSFSTGVAMRLLVLVALGTLVPFYSGWGNWPLAPVLLFVLFFTSGLLTSWRMLGVNVPSRELTSNSSPKERKSRELDQLIFRLWFWGVFVGYLCFFYSGSVRYSILALPPVILIWIATLEHRIKDEYLLRNLIWLGVFLTALYSVFLAYGDYRFAEVYRKNAQEIRRDYVRPGRTVWFTGEWGFRYYLEKEGARGLARTASGPREGDIIVKPYLASPWVTLYDPPEYVELLEQRHPSFDYPIRILDFSSHAGFYSTGWGILPFSVDSGDPWEWFNIFRVKKVYWGPIPQPERHW